MDSPVLCIYGRGTQAEDTLRQDPPGGGNEAGQGAFRSGGRSNLRRWQPEVRRLLEPLAQRLGARHGPAEDLRTLRADGPRPYKAYPRMRKAKGPQCCAGPQSLPGEA